MSKKNTCGEDAFYEPIKRKKKLRKKARPKPIKERTEIVENDGFIYKVRVDKYGVKWHSHADPQRPDSPVLEFPEYPGDENRDGTSTIFASVDEDEVRREGDRWYKEYMEKKERKKRSKQKALPKVEPDPTQDYKDFMGTEEMIDDYQDGVFLDKIPGLYPGDRGTFSPDGGVGGHEFDEY